MNGHTFPLDHIRCLHECDFSVALNPDLDVGELVLAGREPLEEHRFCVTMLDTVTDEFYDRLGMYEKVSPEQFGVKRVYQGYREVQLGPY